MSSSFAGDSIQVLNDNPLNQILIRNQVNQTVTLKRKLGPRFLNELKRHFGTDQQVLGPVVFAFKAALAMPQSVTSLSQFNPLSKSDRKKRSGS